MDSQELTQEEIAIHHAYLTLFSSRDGKMVLDDMKKSYFRPFDESRYGDHSYLVQRATEYNIVHKIERIMARAAEHVQRIEGVEPSRTPKVIIEEGDE